MFQGEFYGVFQREWLRQQRRGQEQSTANKNL